MDIYVFGAGASFSYGVPTMRMLLPEAFSHWFIAPRDPRQFEDALGMVAAAIDNAYGSNLSKAKAGEYPSADSAIILHRADVESLFWMTRESRNSELEEALEIVVFNTLDDRSRIDRHDGEYEHLLSRVNASQETCLISFNYDILADRALASMCQMRDIPWSYCLPFDAGIDDGFPSYRRLSTRLAKVKLLKLHGSFNWRQCERCKALRLYYFLSYPLRPSWPSCKKCSATSYMPVLVAPAPEK